MRRRLEYALPFLGMAVVVVMAGIAAVWPIRQLLAEGKWGLVVSIVAFGIICGITVVLLLQSKRSEP